MEVCLQKHNMIAFLCQILFELIYLIFDMLNHKFADEPEKFIM